MKTLLILIMLLLTTSVCPAVDQQDIHFLWEEANSRLIQAETEDDFLSASKSYKKLLDQGIQTSDLYYNYGTALLRASRPADAVRALSRAQLHDGHSIDIDRNLSIAKNKVSGLPNGDQTWQHTVFFWHYALPANLRHLIALAAFSFFWFTLASRQIGPYRSFKALLAVSILLLSVLASSSLVSLYESTQPLGIVFDVPPVDPPEAITPEDQT